MNIYGWLSSLNEDEYKKFSDDTFIFVETLAGINDDGILHYNLKSNYPENIRSFFSSIGKDLWNDAIDSGNNTIYFADTTDKWPKVSIDAPFHDLVRGFKSDKRSVKAVILTFLYPQTSIPCNQCGRCCWVYPQSKRAYGAKVEKAPWKSTGFTKHRCAALEFDDENGVYQCKIHDNRLGICRDYACGYMKGDQRKVKSKRFNAKRCAVCEKKSRRNCYPCGGVFSVMTDIDVSSFSRTPYFTACKSCVSKDFCSSCEFLTTRIEWFIAYARKNPHDEGIVEESILLKKKIDASSPSVIAPRWARFLSNGLEKIILQQRDRKAACRTYP